MVITLRQVRKSYDITCLIVVAALVGDPNLNLVDRDTARDIRHGLHRLLEVIPEEMTQEEMAVLVVHIAADIEFGQLRTAFTAYRLRLTVLLADQRLNTKLTELQIRLDTEQRLAAANKRTRQVHRYITCLNTLNDIVLLALVIQLQILLVERERGLGVVTQVEIQLRTHLTLNTRLNLLVEIEDVVIARA